MPAVTADDVTIELRPGCLRFWAHVRSAGPREYLVHEWEYGGYERELDLPDGFGGGVEASLANGQLAIRVLRGEPGRRSRSTRPRPAEQGYSARLWTAPAVTRVAPRMPMTGTGDVRLVVVPSPS